MNADLIVEGFISKRLFPKYGDVEPGGFAIFVMNVTKTISGDVDSRVKNKWYKEGEVTFKGNVPEVCGGTKYKVSACLAEDKKYGWGYNIISMNVCADVDTKDGAKKFLSYILTPLQIESLYESFDDPVDLLKRGDVESLCHVKGIGEKTAKRMIEKYENSKDTSRAYSELYDYGLTANMIAKLVQNYGSVDTAISKVKHNPYVLIDECDGFGWSKTDAMALRCGIKEDSDFRIFAFIRYFFSNLAEVDGHTWVTLDVLASNIRGLLPDIPKERLQKIIRGLIDDGTLFYEKEKKRVGLMRYRKLEENICEELVRLRDAESNFNFSDVEETIAECEKNVGFEYTDEQKQAIYDALNNNVFLLTALAGAGKSSLMYPVSRIFRKNGLSFEICALSGKASLNLTEITSEEGKTIHRTLGFMPTGGFAHNKENPLVCDAVILDEVSMVGGLLFYDLIRAIPSGAKLIMIGDPGQLESIGLCNLISDIRSSGAIKHSHLNKIFRQAARSGIITDSIKVYNQCPIFKHGFFGHETHGELEDFDIYAEQDIDSCVERSVSIYKSLIDSGVSTEDIIIVTAKRCLGVASAVSINSKIQSLFKFDDEGIEVPYKDGTTSYAIKYHVGDRVIVTANNYSAETTAKETEPVFNGNIGTVISVDRILRRMIVRFAQGDIIVTGGMLRDMQLGYAITCAKSQGSGFKNAIVVCDSSAYIMLTKELLYTAITRAKKHCYLVGTSKSIETCIKTTRVIKKQTWLSELLMASTH